MFSTSARRKTCATGRATISPRQPPRTPRTADLVKLIADVDFVPADTEVDALLLEARLVKDLQPRFNIGLKDNKSFPYLQIRMREDFPRVEFTRQPRRRGVKLYGPFTSAKSLRAAIQVLQRIFPVPDLRPRHRCRGSALALVSALPAAQHSPVHRPLQFAGHQGSISQTDSRFAAGA